MQTSACITQYVSATLVTNTSQCEVKMENTHTQNVVITAAVEHTFQTCRLHPWRQLLCDL